MATARAKKNILVVEDDGIIAFEIQDRLERLGYSVPAIAISGNEALRLARSFSFDLILMDISLRGRMDGIETAQALKTERDVPVVYVTAHSDAETLHRASQTGPLGYVTKPFSDREFNKTVQTSLSRSKRISSHNFSDPELRAKSPR